MLAAWIVFAVSAPLTVVLYLHLIRWCQRQIAEGHVFDQTGLRRLDNRAATPALPAVATATSLAIAAGRLTLIAIVPLILYGMSHYMTIRDPLLPRE